MMLFKSVAAFLISVAIGASLTVAIHPGARASAQTLKRAFSQALNEAETAVQNTIVRVGETASAAGVQLSTRLGAGASAATGDAEPGAQTGADMSIAIYTPTGIVVNLGSATVDIAGQTNVEAGSAAGASAAASADGAGGGFQGLKGVFSNLVEGMLGLGLDTEAQTSGSR